MMSRIKLITDNKRLRSEVYALKREVKALDISLSKIKRLNAEYSAYELFLKKNNLTNLDLKNKSRKLESVIIVQAFHYYYHILHGFSCSRTSELTNRNHPAILHNCKVVKEQYNRYRYLLEWN